MTPEDTFGHWTVKSVYRVRRKPRGWRKMCECECACGNVRHVAEDQLTSGRSRSCGCKRQTRLTHGGTVGGPSPEYRCWQRMKQRCEYEGATGYDRWGGRGIAVCDQWTNSFTTFLMDMGPKPGPEYSVERRDNGLHYTPENCYWATPKEQARNTRRNRHLTLDGETLPVAVWAEKTGIASNTIRQRLDYCGWSVDRALTSPVQKRRR